MANISGNESNIKILGGFFVYRAKPNSESKSIDKLLQKTGGTDEVNVLGVDNNDAQSSNKEGFEQKGEITGMVLIKQSGPRRFMTYAPIDAKTYTVDKDMEYFKDTMYNNKYDDSVEKVFELEALETLVNKLIVQTVEPPAVVVAPTSAAAPTSAIAAAPTSAVASKPALRSAAASKPALRRAGVRSGLSSNPYAIQNGLGLMSSLFS
jgi:hypothetical protein